MHSPQPTANQRTRPGIPAAPGSRGAASGTQRTCGETSTGVSVFGEKLIKDLEANTEKLNEDTQKNSILVTALVPKLGYDVAAEVAKEAMKNGLTIKEVLLSKELMSEGDIDDLLDIEKLI